MVWMKLGRTRARPLAFGRGAPAFTGRLEVAVLSVLDLLLSFFHPTLSKQLGTCFFLSKCLVMLSRCWLCSSCKKNNKHHRSCCRVVACACLAGRLAAVSGFLDCRPQTELAVMVKPGQNSVVFLFLFQTRLHCEKL